MRWGQTSVKQDTYRLENILLYLLILINMLIKGKSGTHECVLKLQIQVFW